MRKILGCVTLAFVAGTGLLPMAQGQPAGGIYTAEIDGIIASGS